MDADAPSAARIAVLMTCHNRGELTLRCLASLRAQSGPFSLELFLVDDGSSDGTGEAVRAAWPGATIVAGDGSLFWSGGMRLAWERAAASGAHDFYLWLNDDVALDSGALARLLAEACAGARSDGAVIACGNTRDPHSGVHTYGGQIRPVRNRPLRFVLVPPGGAAAPVDVISGNVVLVSAPAFARLGSLDPAYVHTYGDLDYALRAKAAGIPVLSGSGFSGSCAGADLSGSAIDPRLSRLARLRVRIGEARTVHARDWRVLVRRHSGLGPLGAVYRLSPYARILFGRASSRHGREREILVYAPSLAGGLAEHVHYQASELARRGYAVRLLCRADFVKPEGEVPYRQDRALLGLAGATPAARIGRAVLSVVNWYLLAWRIVWRRPAFVLLEANTEFLAPLWFLPHWLLRLTGTHYLVNFHDPVRGPERGWRRATHALAIRLAYAPLTGGLIHGPPPPRAYLPRRLVIREAPFGPFDDLLRHSPTPGLRARLGIPHEAFVLLAFGHVADRKNLDLVIEALREVAHVHLVIAGPPGSGSDRPVAFYRARAAELGLRDRVHFVEGLIPESEVPTYFAAADAVALTYHRAFVSQSGVLQIAALFDRPVLASGGDGPLRATVEGFGLGVTVAPDSAAAIAKSLRELVETRPDLAANFARYRETMSWEVNVDRLLEVARAAGA